MQALCVFAKANAESAYEPRAATADGARGGRTHLKLPTAPPETRQPNKKPRPQRPVAQGTA
eukprot:13504601-Alexandrium_andersonii.AAC.1